MLTKCAPLLADLFTYSYEVEYLNGHTHGLSVVFSNKSFKDYMKHIYSRERTIEETTKSEIEAPYLHLLLIREEDDKLSRKLYDKRDEFGFYILKFLFLLGNIPFNPSYGVNISKLARYVRVMMTSNIATRRWLKEYVTGLSSYINSFKRYESHHEIG